jgi:hypothetical protein
MRELLLGLVVYSCSFLALELSAAAGRPVSVGADVLSKAWVLDEGKLFFN